MLNCLLALRSPNKLVSVVFGWFTETGEHVRMKSNNKKFNARHFNRILKRINWTSSAFQKMRYVKDFSKHTHNILTVVLNWNNNDDWDSCASCVICSWNPHANKNQWFLRAIAFVVRLSVCLSAYASVCVTYDLIALYQLHFELVMTNKIGTTIQSLNWDSDFSRCDHATIDLESQFQICTRIKLKWYRLSWFD